MGKSYWTGWRGKSQFKKGSDWWKFSIWNQGDGEPTNQDKKGSDWWKFSIWNRVMGSKQIRIQLGKMLQENLVGKSCGKILRNREEGTKPICSDWWKFSILNRVWGPTNQNLAWEILAGKSCGKILLDRVEGKKPI